MPLRVVRLGALVLVVSGGLALAQVAAPSAPSQASEAMAQPQALAAPDAAPEVRAAPDDAPATQAASVPVQASPPGVHDLSPWSMFLGADILVKIVMVGLAGASLLTWTIFLAKMAELATARRRLGAALAELTRCASLVEAARAVSERNVLANLVRETAEEVRLSHGIGHAAGLKERVLSVHADVLRVEGRGVRRGLGLLATIGSISPFVGLFGTVWGIMNSFIGISKSQTTNLAVVAPGIAEALLATALGLVAAIPAVIIYNHFARSTKSYLDLASLASGAVMRLLSRDLDRAPGAASAGAAN